MTKPCPRCRSDVSVNNPNYGGLGRFADYRCHRCHWYFTGEVVSDPTGDTQRAAALESYARLHEQRGDDEMAKAARDLIGKTE